MDIVKKNLVSIICGVVALVAIVVWLVPMRSMLDSQKQQLEQDKSEHDKLQQLVRKQRKLPDVKLPASQGGAAGGTAAAAGAASGEEAETANLAGFPSAKLIEQGQQVMQKVKTGSAAVLQRAVQINQRPQLIQGVLPQVDNVMGVQFRDAYLRMVGYPSDPLKTSILAQQLLHAGTPPTPEEIQDRAYEMWKNDYVKKVWELNNQAQNLGEVSQEFAERVKTLPQEVRQQRAEQCMIYMDQDAFTRSPSIAPDSNPSPPEVWFAQVGLWIQQDVCDAIVKINTGSTSVLDAPIKHLRRIMMPVGADMFGIDPQLLGGTPGMRSSGSSAAGSSRNTPLGGRAMANPYSSGYAGARTPAAADAAPATPNTKDYKRSPTGRVSNSLYDVVPFTLVIRVDARKIPFILRDLELNRFFTVHQVNAVIIDTAATMKRDGFVYGSENAEGQTVAAAIEPTTRPTTQPAGGGNDNGNGNDAATGGAGNASKGVPVPVAELTIDCEALLLRAWTTPLMPPDVKKALKIEEKPAEGASPVAANQ